MPFEWHNFLKIHFRLESCTSRLIPAPKFYIKSTHKLKNFNPNRKFKKKIKIFIQLWKTLYNYICTINLIFIYSSIYSLEFRYTLLFFYVKKYSEHSFEKSMSTRPDSQVSNTDPKPVCSENLEVSPTRTWPVSVKLQPETETNKSNPTWNRPAVKKIEINTTRYGLGNENNSH